MFKTLRQETQPLHTNGDTLTHIHVVMTIGDITLTCIHFLETDPNPNNNGYKPKLNPKVEGSFHPKM